MSDAWEFFKDILDELIQSSSVLNDDVSCIFRKIYPYLKQEIFKHAEKKPPRRAWHGYKYDVKKIDICKKNILEIKILLEQTENYRAEFINSYPLWSRHRTNNVEKLNEIAKSLHNEKKVINATKIIGSIVGVAGAAAILTSIFFPPVAVAAITLPGWLGGIGSTMAAALPSIFQVAAPVYSTCAVAGGAASVTGGISQAAAAIAEIKLLKKHIDEAQNALKEDEAAFKIMRKWFNHTREFNKTMEDLLSLSVWKIVLEDFRDFLKFFNKSRSSMKYDEIRLFSKFLSLISKKINVHNLFPPEFTIAIVSLFMLIFFIKRKNRVLLSSIIATIHIGNTLNLMRVGVKAAPAVAAMTTKGTLAGVKRVPGILVRDTAIGIFAGLGLALDTANIVLTSIDVAKGSVSEVGKEIEKASTKLDEELELLRRVYSDLLYGEMYSNDWKFHRYD